MAVAGCRSGSSVNDPPGPAAASAVFELLEESPAHGEVLAEEFAPLDSGRRTFVEVNEDGSAGREVVIDRRKTDEFGGATANAEDEARIEYWKGDGGDVVTPAVLERKDKALSLFEPPLAAGFAKQPAGKTRSSDSSMRVMDSEHRNRQRHSGKATQAITYAADQRVRIFGREIVARRVDIHFTADLGVAKADTTTSLFIEPKAGVVAQRSVEKVTALGAFTTTTKRTLAARPSK